MDKHLEKKTPRTFILPDHFWQALGIDSVKDNTDRTKILIKHLSKIYPKR